MTGANTVPPETIAFAHRLADAAGEVIRPYFRRRLDIENKRAGENMFDPVTAADKGAEEAIRAILAKERPTDGVLGEEYGEVPGTSGFRWVLDPVDGTKAFITGRHEWGTLIALEDVSVEGGGKPVLGIIDQPCLGERFVGVNGVSELRANGETTQLQTRPCAALSDAVLCATHPDFFPDAGDYARFQRVQRACKLSRWGGDCYIYAVLALGFCDLVVEHLSKRWDIAALVPVVEGAGGFITDWQGKPCGNGGTIIAAGDARVHAAALELLNG